MGMVSILVEDIIKPFKKVAKLEMFMKIGSMVIAMLGRVIPALQSTIAKENLTVKSTPFTALALAPWNIPTKSMTFVETETLELDQTQ